MSTGDERQAYLALLEGTGTELLRLPMLTGSMAPAIFPGDILVIEPTQGRRVHLGDVAVFYARNRLTAHRVLLAVWIGRRRWLLEKGDQNDRGGWVDDRRVVGRVVAVGRQGVENRLPRSWAAAGAVLRERCKLVYYTLLKRKCDK